MIEIRDEKTLARLRQQTLAAQGLLHERPFGSGLRGTHAAIKHLGYVQIDSIAVVERAHHHVLYSRVPNYVPAYANQLLRKRAIFEYWAHAAAFLPMEDFRFSLPYKQAICSGQVHWYRNTDTKLMNELLARIRAEGPLRARDLESRTSAGNGWWDWKPAKRAIEQLYMRGDLMIADREGFQKTYDLTERVLPSAINTSTPSSEEFAEHLLAQQLRSCAFVSLQGISYLRRVPGLKAAVQNRVSELVDARALEELRLPNAAVLYCEAGTLDRPKPRVKERAQILSPFDNCVIQRERLNALFDFSFQLECYLPAARRRFGYFCLPLLYRNRFVGRLDCKAHRQESRLEIKSLHIESPKLDEMKFLSALRPAVERFMRFQGCHTVDIGEAVPSWVVPALKANDVLPVEPGAGNSYGM